MNINQRKRVFVSFDFDHDEDLKNLLVGQSRHPDTPFELADWSIKEPIAGNWQAKARTRIRSVDQVIVLCGEWTHTAQGVSVEVQIAREERRPYFLLWGRAERQCTRPRGVAEYEKIYRWTWDNLKALIGGAR
jgi:hypothetical protein